VSADEIVLSVRIPRGLTSVYVRRLMDADPEVSEDEAWLRLLQHCMGGWPTIEIVEAAAR